MWTGVLYAVVWEVHIISHHIFSFAGWYISFLKLGF